MRYHHKTESLKKINSNNFYYGYIIVIASYLIIFFHFGIFLSFGVFFKPILNEFGLDSTTTSGIASLTLLVQGVVGVFMGRLTDKIGPRTILTFCTLLAGVGYILTSRVTEAWHLYILYGVTLGIGLSGMMVPLTSTVSRWFDRRRSLMIGLMLTSMGMGSLIMTPLISHMLTVYNWRMVYLILGSITLFVTVIAAQLLKRDPGKISRTSNTNNTSYIDIKMESSGYDFVDAIKTLQFWITLVIFFCAGFCRFTVTVHVVPYATELGIPPVNAANVLAIIGGGSIITRPLAGIFADRRGCKKAFTLGYIITITSFLFFFSSSSNFMLIYIAAILFSFNWGLSSSEPSLVAELFGTKSLGAIFGIMGLGYTIGGSIGPVLAGYIFDTTNNYSYIFSLCAGVSIACTLLTFLLRPATCSGSKDE